MIFWNKNIRFIIYIFSLLLAFGLFLLARQQFPGLRLRYIRLTEWYGLIAVGFLYLALLITPLYRAIPSVPGKVTAVISRRAFGLSCFFFALLHSLLGFFRLMGGFEGLGFLGQNYLIVNALGSAALIILAFMAATSFDYAVNRLGKRWKQIHRFVYLAGWLVFFHTLLLGAHFVRLSSAPAVIFLSLIFLLLVLQSIRLSKAIKQRYPIAGRYSLAALLLLIALLYLIIIQGDLNHYLGTHVH